MEKKVYGILDRNDCFIDTSNSAQGVKNYATRNGYNKVFYRIGYNVFPFEEKINNKWVKSN